LRAVSVRIRVRFGFAGSGWRGVGCAEWVPDAVKPGIHCARTHWIRGFMTSIGSEAGGERGRTENKGRAGTRAGLERGRGRAGERGRGASAGAGERGRGAGAGAGELGGERGRERGAGELGGARTG
jgi:hypothetical protein